MSAELNRPPEPSRLDLARQIDAEKGALRVETTRPGTLSGIAASWTIGPGTVQGVGCRRVSDTWFLFLHGINARTEDHWRLTLDQTLVRAGQDPMNPARVITPDYRAASRGKTEAPTGPRSTWRRPDKDGLRKAQTSYSALMAFLESQLRPLANGVAAWVQPPELSTVPQVGSLLDDARNYARSAEVRAAVHSIVLESLEAVPSGSRIVILAHSLGPVVAADIIKKLPAEVAVPVLVTIGSPLGGISSRIDEHELIDAKSSSAKTAREKLGLIDKAYLWLRGRNVRIQPMRANCRAWQRRTARRSPAESSACRRYLPDPAEATQAASEPRLRAAMRSTVLRGPGSPLSLTTRSPGIFSMRDSSKVCM